MRKPRKPKVRASRNIGRFIYEEIDPESVPVSAMEDPVWRLHEDTVIHAVLQGTLRGDDHVLGLCLQEHVDSPLVTKIRVKVKSDDPFGEKSILRVDAQSPSQAVRVFTKTARDVLRQGEVFTPNLRRSQYVAYCRMLLCTPLPADDRNDPENSAVSHVVG
jgi:hypothetical protein